MDINRKKIWTNTVRIVCRALIYCAVLLLVMSLGTRILSKGAPGDKLIVLQAQVPEGTAADQTAVEMKSISGIVRQRLDYLGFTSATVQADGKKITVKHLPANADLKSVAVYLKTSHSVAFKDADGKTFLTGGDITTVKAMKDDAGKVKIIIYFTQSGRAAFQSATKRIAARAYEKKNYVTLKIDGKEVFRSSVASSFAETGITALNGTAVLLKNATLNYAQTTAKTLSAGGALPYPLK